MIDLKAALANQATAQKFAASFAGAYLTPAFGARSKSEIDLLVLTSLIDAGALDPAAPIYDIARAFNITPARVRTLIFNWQLRSTAGGFDLRSALVAALEKTRFAKDGTYLAFGIESPLLREEIVARLKAKGVFADATFAREIVRLPVDAFVEFLDDLVEPEVKKAFKAKLVKDKQLEDKSFTAIAKGVLGKLAEKVAGKAGEAIGEAVVDGAKDVLGPAAEQVTTFLVSLLKGDTDTAAKIAATQTIV
ncbi:MAG: hypothetical protein ACXU82_08880 [Caulobacteraceae bacterium]